MATHSGPYWPNPQRRRTGVDGPATEVVSDGPVCDQEYLDYLEASRAGQRLIPDGSPIGLNKVLPTRVALVAMFRNDPNIVPAYVGVIDPGKPIVRVDGKVVGRCNNMIEFIRNHSGGPNEGVYGLHYDLMTNFLEITTS